MNLTSKGCRCELLIMFVVKYKSVIATWESRKETY